MLFPHRYIDRSRIKPIGKLFGSEESVTVVGQVNHIYEAGRGKKKRLEVVIEDETGSLKGVWFRGTGYFKKLFRHGLTVAFFGDVKRYGSSLTMAHPEVDPLESEGDIDTLQQIVPVYPGNKDFSKAYISNKLIQGWIYAILKKREPSEFLPDDILNEYSLPDRNEALRMIHQPQQQKDTQKAIDRFKFEELFLFELCMARIKLEHLEKKKGTTFDSTGPLLRTFFNEVLPFQLTEGQISALRDIKKDLASGYQMHRLIQGDVGSGKTIIAIGALLMALDNGYQAVFMAPTEILAEQHYHTLSNYLDHLDVNTRLLTGGQNKKLRTDILTSIEGGACQITVGTHAIIQKQVHFHKLGLAVIDEQHRFGVKQRAEILNKGDQPHLLVLSATPIPRSLALTIYSDLDISMMTDIPEGRKPVKTAIRTDKSRDEVYRFVRDNVLEGGQVYIVYPLIEESEAMDLKDATLGYEKLQKRFPDLEIGLVHGRMKSEEKESVMNRFYQGEVQILVSTTVIEVGVDVSNANVMIIEHAERFGLSQLHQLRGRIGRGKRQSYCILMPGNKLGKPARFRLNKMIETNNGFEIAEADLKLRGPGDFLGTKQSGLPDFRYADIVEDQWLLAQAKQIAWKLMGNDPDLAKPDHQNLKNIFEPYFKERSAFFGLG